MKNALYLNFGSMSVQGLNHYDPEGETQKEIKEFIENNEITDVIVNNESFNFGKKIDKSANYDGAALAIANNVAFDMKNVKVHSFSTLSDDYGPMPSANLRAATKLHMLTDAAGPESSRYMYDYSSGEFMNVSDKSLDNIVKKVGPIVEASDDKTIIDAHKKLNRYKKYTNEYMNESGYGSLSQVLDSREGKASTDKDFKYISEYVDPTPCNSKELITELKYAPYISNKRMESVLLNEIDAIEADPRSYCDKDELVKNPYEIERMIQKELELDEDAMPDTMRPELRLEVSKMESLVGMIAIMETLERDEGRQNRLKEKGQELTLNDQKSLPDDVRKTLENQGLGVKENKVVQNKSAIDTEPEASNEIEDDFEMDY